MWQQSRRRAQTNRRDQGQSGKLSTRSCVQSFPSAFAFLFEVALFFVNLPIVGRTFVCFRRRFCSPAQFFLGAFTQSGACMSFVPLFKVLVSCTQIKNHANDHTVKSLPVRLIYLIFRC